MAADTETRLRAVLADHLGEDIARRAEPAAKLVADLGLDSLDIVDLIMGIEDEFDIEISDTEAEPFGVQHAGEAPKSLSDLIALIDTKRRENANA